MAASEVANPVLRGATRLLYRGFPTHFRPTDNANDHRDRYHLRFPTVPGRSFRAFAPDGALRLFGDRYLPARTDLERFRCLRQAALRGDRKARADRRG